MSVFDLMSFLFWLSMACLLLAGLDALYLAALHLRATLRRRRFPQCACRQVVFLDESDAVDPFYDHEQGKVHELRRCYPEREAA